MVKRVKSWKLMMKTEAASDIGPIGLTSSGGQAGGDKAMDNGGTGPRKSRPGELAYVDGTRMQRNGWRA